MSFTSLVFLFIFFPIAIIVYTVSPKRQKNRVLLILSLIFYSWGRPSYLTFIMLSIVVTWFGTKYMLQHKKDREEAKFLATCLIVFNVAILAFFKYYGFLIDNISMITRMNLKIIDIALPFGISFYTFKIISYIVDVYKEDARPARNFSEFALYISIFSQIGAGPIVQYNEMQEELRVRKQSFERFGIGVEKFVLGLAKKVLIANNMALIWSQVKGIAGLEMSAMTAWLGIIAFTLQIYFDFSGYSDMAIGTGYMLGFKWAENFEYPYTTTSATEFWRKWHISLGNWFKRYIYFPLGGSKVDGTKFLRNIFVVWLITGLWHGSSWNFVFWGLYFGVLVYLEKVLYGKALLKLPRSIRIIYCMIVVIVGWVMFDLGGVGEIFKFYSNMLVFGASSFIDSNAIYIFKTSWLIYLAAILGSSRFIINLINNIKSRFGKRGYIGISIYYLIIFIISVASLVGESYSPFLYFKF